MSLTTAREHLSRNKYLRCTSVRVTHQNMPIYGFLWILQHPVAKGCSVIDITSMNFSPRAVLPSVPPVLYLVGIAIKFWRWSLRVVRVLIWKKTPSHMKMRNLSVCPVIQRPLSDASGLIWKQDKSDRSILSQTSRTKYILKWNKRKLWRGPQSWCSPHGWGGCDCSQNSSCWCRPRTVDQSQSRDPEDLYTNNCLL